MEIFNDFSTSVKKAFDEIDPKWSSYKGLVICGTHNPHDVEEMIEKIRVARESGEPFLGICAGHQYAAIEYARNVLNIKDATSEEFGQGTFVVKKRKNLQVGLHHGESYWNNYEVVIKTNYLDNFITTQYHPEYQSSLENPHPLLVKFIKLCKKNSFVDGRHPWGNWKILL